MHLQINGFHDSEAIDVEREGIVTLIISKGKKIERQLVT